MPACWQVHEDAPGEGHQAAVRTLPCDIHILELLYSDILTRQAFLNAITIVNIIGGSTNSVSAHFIASPMV